ncbi:hypothetical protein WR25_02337 isoform G [Diploscapter pachys]|nr:hypothetical protein WR25_02337 isoform G [Diploscapter pachys]
MSSNLIPPPDVLKEPIKIPPRQLFGPGPSNMPDAVAHTQSMSLLGHLHPEFLKVMHDVRDGLKYLFQTTNDFTMCASGTGHSGMECAFLNLLERGESLLCVTTGLWGRRAESLGQRLGLQTFVVEAPQGEVVSVEEISKAIEQHKPTAMFVCIGESSTGIVQPIQGLSEACKKHNTLLIADTVSRSSNKSDIFPKKKQSYFFQVASIGAEPFKMDEWGVDCVYSATQKVLNAPPGLAPISFSKRAMDKIRNRKTKVASFYFDALELGNYWGCDGQITRYHHTAPISSVYAIRSALSIIANESLEHSWERHKTNVKLLHSLLEENGFECFVQKPENRLACLTVVKVPQGVDGKKVTASLLGKGLEIANGLGESAAKLWRIGTFGGNSDEQKIRNVVKMLKDEVQNPTNKL